MRTSLSSNRLLGVSASVHAGIHPPPPGLGLHTTPTLGVGLDPLPPPDPPTSPRVQAWITLWPDPPTSPLGLGLDTPP